MADNSGPFESGGPLGIQRQEAEAPTIGTDGERSSSGSFSLTSESSTNPQEASNAFPGSMPNCGNHPGVEAVVRCQTCRAPLCQTCDFAFPGGQHFCPTCATKTTAPMSSDRKKFLTVSILCGIWVTVLLVLLLLGAFEEMASDDIGAQVIGTLIMIPALLGLGLSLASMDSRAGNSGVVWGVVIWNVVLTVIWIALCVIGMTMQ